MRPPQKAGASGIDLMIVCTANGTSRDEDDIPSRFDCIQSQSHSFAQAALDAIALNRIADAGTHRECEAAIRQVILQYADHQLSVAGRRAKPSNFLDTLILPNAISLLHLLDGFARRQLYRQLRTTTAPAPLEHIAPTRRTHAFPEAVSLQSFANFWLPRTLCSHANLLRLVC